MQALIFLRWPGRWWKNASSFMHQSWQRWNICCCIYRIERSRVANVNYTVSIRQQYWAIWMIPDEQFLSQLFTSCILGWFLKCLSCRNALSLQHVLLDSITSRPVMNLFYSVFSYSWVLGTKEYLTSFYIDFLSYKHKHSRWNLHGIKKRTVKNHSCVVFVFF